MKASKLTVLFIKAFVQKSEASLYEERNILEDNFNVGLSEEGHSNSLCCLLTRRNGYHAFK